ncbi:MAG: Gfo/Idh/MocA family oxidoreductase [Armatimonadetes bacterium]|jgi:UDP-N-acetylglucosamine 3-dehydrogenase|nr:Gfo/Idh/MocA family oxidoreductase [Armatimonadota bacterium]
MSSIGFGIIGCGGISNVHLTALSKRDDARVVCVADVNPEAAKAQAERYQVAKWVTDPAELVAMPEVQAVVVCTPTFRHAEGVLAAAAAGKHVLCEKPISLSLEEADQMIAACEKAGSLFMVAFVRRFCNEWLKLRDIIREGRLGRPVVWRTANASSGPASPWFLDAEKGGGPFIDGCVHDWDFARFTFGEPEKVVASISRMKETTTALDTGTAIVKFKSGDEIVRTWSWGLPGTACSGQSMQDVIGPKGALRFPGAPAEGSKLNYFYYIDGDGKEHPIEYEHTGGQEWFDAQMDHFVTCVREGRRPCVTGEDGRNATELALAVLKAGASRETVHL